MDSASLDLLAEIDMLMNCVVKVTVKYLLVKEDIPEDVLTLEILDIANSLNIVNIDMKCQKMEK